MRGVELVLDVGETPLLDPSSDPGKVTLVGVFAACDEVSPLLLSCASIALCRTTGLKVLVDFLRLLFCTRFALPAGASILGVATGAFSEGEFSEGQAHSDAKGIAIRILIRKMEGAHTLGDCVIDYQALAAA